MFYKEWKQNSKLARDISQLRQAEHLTQVGWRVDGDGTANSFSQVF